MPDPFQKYWYDFDDNDFEWDLAKNESNLLNHGIDFAFAKRIFTGEIVKRRDTRKKTEVVYQAIGEVADFMVFLVYTIRNHRCRIISARLATPDEAEVYHER